MHGRRAARRASGLEAALVNHSPIDVTALDRGDNRVVRSDVAGEAALLVAKAHKIYDRHERGRAGRVVDKDAADVLRLMQTTSPATVGATLAALREHRIAGAASTDALTFLEALFGRIGRPGIAMASRALRLAMPQATVEALCVSYTREMLEAARPRL